MKKKIVRIICGLLLVSLAICGTIYYLFFDIAGSGDRNTFSAAVPQPGNMR